jgi:hypothetical protein
MPRVAAKTVSDAVAKSQLANAYYLARRSRLQQLSEVEERKLISALSNKSEPFGWSLTTSCKVSQVSTGWRIGLRRRPGGKSKIKSERKRSREYQSQIAAENDMFNYRKNLESPKSKKRLSEWELSLHSSSLRVELIADAADAETTTNPPQGAGITARRRKAIAMSSNARLQEQAGIASRNPMLPPDTSLRQYTRQVAASKVQNYIRMRQLSRGVRAQVRAKTDQTYREFVLSYLSKIISAPRHEEKWRQLLLGAQDTEVAETYSEYDREHALKKARCIANALRVLCERTKKNEPCTWQQACEVAATQACTKTQSRTIQNWYRELHHKFDDDSTMLDLRFKRSAKGRVEWAAKSPFAFDESLMVQLKLWARADLEHLTVQKCADWINNTLLSDWTPGQLKTDLNVTSFPVQPRIVRRWMRDAGFKYEAYRKCYYVDRHEDPDVVADRTDYIPKCFEVELREHVWVQLPLETYTRVMELKRKHNEPRKKRTKGGAVKPHSNTETEKQMNEFHESLTYRYETKEGEPFVEAHVDMVYSYSDFDDEIGLPKLDCEETGGVGGWLSCRILPCVRPVTAIGQDEVIFHPSTLNENCWIVDDISPLRSKGGTGNGKMISGTKTRMHGFGGPKISADELKKINEKRDGETYSGYAFEAARNIFGASGKPKLTVSPFVRMINYGAHKDGYWNANHMLLQVADCQDVWDYLDRTSYLLPLWEFDHSSGHDSEREDGLTTSATHLKMSWGKGRKMRESELTWGCVGTIHHEDRAYAGSTYHHSF